MIAVSVEITSIYSKQCSKWQYKLHNSYRHCFGGFYVI